MRTNPIITGLLSVVTILFGCNNGSPESKKTDSPKGIVINEIAAHDQTVDNTSWVEIANSTDQPVSLDGIGLFIFDEYFNGKKIWTGSGSLAAGARLVVSTSDESLKIGISSASEFRLVLGKAKDNASDEFVRSQAFSTPAECYERGSYQRIPDMTGGWRNMTYNSLGKANEVFDFRSAKKNAVWLWSTFMSEWLADDAKIIKQVKALGYDHILLNYSAFDSEGNARTARRFMAACEEAGLDVHAWIQCFHTSAGWKSAIKDDTPDGEYDQDLFDDIIAHAKKYIERFGVKGLHLDYIRYGGKAYSHTGGYQNACGSVTEFCRQIKEFAGSYDEGIVISAAMMVDGNTQSGIIHNGKYYYGQDAVAMGRYVDIFMPMIYRYNESGSYSESWCRIAAETFAAAGGISECWAGITTYSYPGGSIKGMTAEQILDDLNIFSSTSAKGIVLFRYGYGTFPDVNNLWTTKQ